MIIAVPDDNDKLDDITKKAFTILRNLYPNETSAILSRKNLFLLDSSGRVVHDHLNLPNRITFTGHAHKLQYDAYHALEFANRLVVEITEASKVNPRMRNAIKAIDLIGCETGLVDEKGNSFAQIVADHLFSAGFIIRISAFTNLDAIHPHPIAASASYHPDRLLSNTPTSNASAFCFSLFRAEINFQNYLELVHSKRDLYQIMECKPVRNFYDALQKLKTKWDTKKTSTEQCKKDLLTLGRTFTQHTTFQPLFETAPTLSIKMMAILSALDQDAIVIFFQNGIPNKPTLCVSVVLHRLNIYLQQLETRIKEYTAIQAAVSELIAVTDDPRHYFDNTSVCTFVPTPMKIATSPVAFYNRQRTTLLDRSKQYTVPTTFHIRQLQPSTSHSKNTSPHI